MSTEKRAPTIRTDGRVSAAAVVFRYRGSLQLTVVVKALFSLVPDGVAEHRGPGEIAEDDRTFGGLPSRSVEIASDLAPYRRLTDVTFVGHARAPGGRPAPASSVRLGLARDGRTLLDKVLHVFGDRGPSGGPAPWTEMPIVWERALGGPGEPNPVGTATPNIVDPRDPRRAAGLAPISRFWPVRKRLLGKIDRRALEAPIHHLPDEMPWEYYQSAPPDQQVEGPLAGGEWLVLDGVHPSLPRLQTRLPEARAAARVRFAAGREQAIELGCDTLAIDGDRQSISMVWRGRVEVPGGEAEIGALTILAGLEAPRAPVDFARLASEAPASPAARAAAEAGAGEATVAIAAEAAGAARPVVPFAASPLPERAPPSASASATPWSGHGLSPIAGSAPGEATIAPPGAPREAAGEATFALRAEDHRAALERGVAPFAIQPAGSGRGQTVATALPFGGEHLGSAPRPIAGEETLALGAPSRPVAPPPMMPIAPPAPEPLAAAAPPPAAPRIEVDAPPAPPPPPAAPPPSPPAPPPPKPALADRLRASGASERDVAAMLRALAPPPPPPPDEEG